jgi:hypothetical protein
VSDSIRKVELDTKECCMCTVQTCELLIHYPHIPGSLPGISNVTIGK